MQNCAPNWGAILKAPRGSAAAEPSGKPRPQHQRPARPSIGLSTSSNTQAAQAEGDISQAGLAQEAKTSARSAQEPASTSAVETPKAPKQRPPRDVSATPSSIAPRHIQLTSDAASFLLLPNVIQLQRLSTQFDEATTTTTDFTSSASKVRFWDVGHALVLVLGTAYACHKNGTLGTSNVVLISNFPYKQRRLCLNLLLVQVSGQYQCFCGVLHSTL